MHNTHQGKGLYDANDPSGDNLAKVYEGANIQKVTVLGVTTFYNRKQWASNVNSETYKDKALDGNIGVYYPAIDRVKLILQNIRLLNHGTPVERRSLTPYGIRYWMFIRP